MFDLFVARRYLRAKRKQVVISVITPSFGSRQGVRSRCGKLSHPN